MSICAVWLVLIEGVFMIPERCAKYQVVVYLCATRDLFNRKQIITNPVESLTMAQSIRTDLIYLRLIILSKRLTFITITMTVGFFWDSTGPTAFRYRVFSLSHVAVFMHGINGERIKIEKEKSSNCLDQFLNGRVEWTLT